MKTDSQDKEIKIKISTAVYALLILIFLVIGVLSVIAYGTNSDIGRKISAKISKIVPFPAAVVDWRHIVFMRDVESNLATVEMFYKTQNFASEGLRVDFSTEEGKKRLKIKEREILDKMVEDQIIEILAKKQGISVTNEDAQKILNVKLNEFGTADDVKNDLANSYGWSLDDFKRKVVIPSLYSEALALKVADQDSNTVKAKEKIEKAQKELANGKEFSEVVRSYSEGASKEKGGNLGWVSKEQVLPELQKVLFENRDFKKDSIVESSIGFHLLEIENSKEEDGSKKLQLKQVFVSKNTFADWLGNQKKQLNIIVPLKDFIWNKSAGSIDFRDMNMNTFEKEQRSKVQGDASIML